jgi:hypothetical protein
MIVSWLNLPALETGSLVTGNLKHFMAAVTGCRFPVAGRNFGKPNDSQLAEPSGLETGSLVTGNLKHFMAAVTGCRFPVAGRNFGKPE